MYPPFFGLIYHLLSPPFSQDRLFIEAVQDLYQTALMNVLFPKLFLKDTGDYFKSFFEGGNYRVLSNFFINAD